MLKKILGLLLILFLGTTGLWAAKDRSSYLDETYLKKVFTFKSGEKLKYEKCPAMHRYKVCFYIWGENMPEDNMLPMPMGNQVRVTYQKNSTRLFDMFTKDKDKKDKDDVDFIENLGEKSAWIKQRKELLVLLANKMVIAVHINVQGEKNSKEKAIQVAKYVIEKEKQ